MSKKFYNVCVAEENGDSTYFQRVGVAFPSKKGSKSFMTIKLTAVPVNGELVLFEPKAKEE